MKHKTYGAFTADGRRIPKAHRRRDTRGTYRIRLPKLLKKRVPVAIRDLERQVAYERAPVAVVNRGLCDLCGGLYRKECLCVLEPLLATARAGWENE